MPGGAGNAGRIYLFNKVVLPRLATQFDPGKTHQILQRGFSTVSADSGL